MNSDSVREFIRTPAAPLAAVANDQVTIRPARIDDCGDIAELFLISSDGMAEYIWGQMDMPGLGLAEIGACRYAREGVAFSYQNCLVAEQGGSMIGMVHGYEMEGRNPAAAEDVDPVLQPYSELEDPGSLYISGLARYPEHRGRGVGTRLMVAAEARARALGLPRLSLICIEANIGAMRLYQSLGFGEAARRAIVPHPSLHYSEGDAVLLVAGLPLVQATS